MKRSVGSIVAVLGAALLLGACTQARNETGGALVGGALGGLVGSTIGKGDGRVAAAVAGALAGAFIGSSVGKSMDELDQIKASRALEAQPTGGTATWTNPDSGARYAVTPTRTYYRDSGSPCRDFTTEAWIDGRREVVKGTACREADGTWRSQGS